MAQVSIRKVVKEYEGGVQAVKGIDLEIADHEFVVLVGPSGCGKSTTLRMIAGLEEISGGEIAIGGQVVNDIPPRDRDIAMVFQNYALYPHMTVFDNMAFGLTLRKFPKDEIRRRVEHAARILDIGNLLARKPKALSGGQRQRVAMGRAIVRDPKVFLFDEPLSNLDAQLRVQMRTEIKALHQRLKSTIVYVTHDQIEAMTLADRIVLLKDGVIEQQGAPLELFERPTSKFVAGFLGSPPMNFVPCRLEGGELLFADGRRLALPSAKLARLAQWQGRALMLGIRPEHFGRAEGSIARAGQVPLRVVIDLVQPTGTRTYATFRLGEAEVSAELPAHAVEAPGTELALLVDLDRAILLDPQTERVI